MITTGFVIFNLFQLVAEKDPTSDSEIEDHEHLDANPKASPIGKK